MKDDRLKIVEIIKDNNVRSHPSITGYIILYIQFNGRWDPCQIPNIWDMWLIVISDVMIRGRLHKIFVESHNGKSRIM